MQPTIPHSPSRPELESGNYSYSERAEQRAEKETAESILEDSIDTIQAAEDEAVRELGVQRGTLEAVEATDQIIVADAEEQYSSAESTPEDRQDALDAVAIETALEMTHGATPDRTALSLFDIDHYPAEVQATIDRYNRHHVTLPSGQDAGPLLETAAKALSAHPVMEGGGEVEMIPQPLSRVEEAPEESRKIESSEGTRALKFEKTTEALRPRIDEAVEAVEFQASPEVKKAIESYYMDHYKMADVLESVVRNETIDPAVFSNTETKLDALKMNEALRELIGMQSETADRSSVLSRVNELLKGQLFREAAVGVTTIGEPEMARLTDLNNQLQEAARNEDIYLRGAVDESALRRGIEASKKLFWDDSRHAGQLLFHNTPFIGDLSKNGFKLQTRSRQREETGAYRAVTMASEHHSRSIHFSEDYMPDAYKFVMGGTHTNETTLGATVALPIAELVRTLPYARSGEYGTLAIKPEAVHAENIPVKDAVVDYENAGSDDKQGERGNDRRFFPDPIDKEKAVDYEIDFGQDMASPTGNVSRVIFLQHDIDQSLREDYETTGDTTGIDYRQSIGSGYGHPLVESLQYDSMRGVGAQDRVSSSAEGTPFVNPATLTNRQGLVAHDERLTRTATSEGSYREGMTHADQLAELRADISRMQQESINLPQYRGKVVAMLRAGVMAYEPID